jgi:hypothetical protein
VYTFKHRWLKVIKGKDRQQVSALIYKFFGKMQLLNWYTLLKLWGDYISRRETNRASDWDEKLSRDVYGHQKPDFLDCILLENLKKPKQQEFETYSG